ncbi:hypothetical protein SASPL_147295 [Salvia splendens]|uniref:EF-hand domain-containing protein n=1 Tax=Salvia splendens TaxID=180675 RepID=A0A8X8WEC9_SALSN|nr:uncharacterized protein LOC121776572 [Salvia splendens]KAG6393065.1 hypothetical protein SASPL_147295 [Salvia splendens]
MGEGNRRIARALYERASQSEKREASEFYERLKSKRDGKIRVLEFKKGVESSLSKEKIFKQLDLNGDGFLEFEDVLLLFYHSVKKAITILRCRGCSVLIFATAYSCFQCFFNTADHRFSLCHACYATGKVQHGHPLTSSSSSSSSLLRDQALLIKFSDLISAHPSTSRSKKELKRMWEEAKSKAGAASPAVEGMAVSYFKSMGSDNRVDIKKFSSTLTKQQEEFLTPAPDSDPATNYMKNTLAMKFRQTSETKTAYHTASPSTPYTYYANHPIPIPIPSSYGPNVQTSSSNGTISPLKMVTTTFKIVEMALTIASLSGMCTIM